jgi:hypothetical protein
MRPENVGLDERNQARAIGLAEQARIPREVQ